MVTSLDLGVIECPASHGAHSASPTQKMDGCMCDKKKLELGAKGFVLIRIIIIHNEREIGSSVDTANAFLQTRYSLRLLNCVGSRTKSHLSQRCFRPPCVHVSVI